MPELNIQTPRWAVPLLKAARYKGAWGGRGSGKSHLFAEMLVEEMILNPGTRAVCIRETQKSLAQSSKRLIEDKIIQLGVTHLFDVQQAVIKRVGSDGIAIFNGMQSHNSDSIKSLEGYRIAWVEEAQTMSARSLEMLRPTLRRDDAEMWFSWNPSMPTDPIDVLLRGENPPPGAVVVNANWSDNPWFPASLRTEMEYDKRRDPGKYSHIWLGEYNLKSEARVFRNWKIEEFDAPPDAIHRFGADWGFSVDPTVLVRAHIIGRTLYVDYEAYQVGCEITATPDLFLTVPEAEKWTIVADSARPETISHMRKHGFPKIMPAVKGARSLEEGVEWLKSYDIVVHPRCLHLIDELSMYCYETDPLTGAVIPVLADKHNHVIDALRYACESVRRTAQAIKRPVVNLIPTRHHYG